MIEIMILAIVCFGSVYFFVGFFIGALIMYRHMVNKYNISVDFP